MAVVSHRSIMRPVVYLDVIIASHAPMRNGTCVWPLLGAFAGVHGTYGPDRQGSRVLG
jgi:hypothetical protein